MSKAPHFLTLLCLRLSTKHIGRAILCIKSTFGTGQSREQKSLLNTSLMKVYFLGGGSLMVLEWLLAGPTLAELLGDHSAITAQSQECQVGVLRPGRKPSVWRWLKGRRTRSREGISGSSTLPGRINCSYTAAKRKNRPAESAVVPAWRGLGSPPGSSADLSWVPFCEVPMLSVTKTKASGQDEHTGPGPRGVTRGGCCDSSKAGWRKETSDLPVTRLVVLYKLGNQLNKFPVALDV